MLLKNNDKIDSNEFSLKFDEHNYVYLYFLKKKIFFIENFLHSRQSHLLIRIHVM
jgi:hypothetical protein